MKNILITGFFGEGNLGDEAILKAICENLPENIVPIITTGSIQHNFGKDIKRRGFFSWPYFLKAAFCSPVTIFTGGILQDWSWEGVTFFAYRIIAAAKMGSIPVLYGAGIGPLRSNLAKILVKKALSYVKVAYVRDKTSYDLYKSLLPNANVKLGTDWTWHFPVEKVKEIRKQNDSNLCFNLRPWKYNSKLIDEALKLINCFPSKKVALIARKGDNLNYVFNLIDIKEVNDFVECAKFCLNFSYGVAMRYHVALAMLRAGLETKLVCYDDKVIDLAESAGLFIKLDEITQGYKKASDEFFTTNEARFQEMKDSFLELISRVYYNKN